MRIAFDRWVARQDEVTVIEVNGLSSWVSLALFIVAFAVVLDWEGGLIDARAGAAVFLPAFLNALVERFLVRRAGGRMTTAAWGLEIANVGLLRFFCVGWIVYSTSGTAAAAFSTFALLQGTYHGFFHRASWREPFVTLSGIAGALIGIAIATPVPDYARAALFVSLPAASLMELFAGHYGLTRDRERKERDGLRDALEASLLEDGMRLNATVEQFAATSHDVRNALTATLCIIEGLVEDAKGGSVSAPIGEMLVAADGSLRDALAIAEADRKAVREAGNSRQPVAVARIVASTVEGARLRFPRVKISANIDSERSALVAGGVAAARRIIENLVTNACEGNGRALPTTVSVRHANAGSAIVITIDDDGPGFSAEYLTGNVERVHSTKPEGTGLGLLTTERFVRASLGRIVRSNRPEGGARVTVELSVAPK